MDFVCVCNVPVHTWPESLDSEADSAVQIMKRFKLIVRPVIKTRSTAENRARETSSYNLLELLGLHTNCI